MDLSIIIAALIGGVFQLIGAIIAIRNGSKKKKTAAVALLAVSLAVMLFALFVLTPAAITLKVTYPLLGSFASTTVQVQGYSQNIPAGEKIWVVVYDTANNNNKFYPNKNPSTVYANGDWQDSANLGGANDVNYTFLICAALVNKEGQDKINNYWQSNANQPNTNPGWTSLPDEIKIYALTAVIRSP